MKQRKHEFIPPIGTSPTWPKKEELDNAWYTAQRLARESIGYRAEVHQLVKMLTERMMRDLAGFNKPVLAWSGGKDSIALEVLLEEANLELDSFLILSNLEFPTTYRFVEEHQPKNLELILKDRLNMDWLKRNPGMMFCMGDTGTGKTRHYSRWLQMLQQAGQREYMSRSAGDVMLLGRRQIERNICGTLTPSGNRGYEGRNGYRLSPLWDVTHEETFAILSVYDKQIPDFYFGLNGFVYGPTAWPLPRSKTLAEGWAVVEAYDTTILDKAAERGLPGTKEALALR